MAWATTANDSKSSQPLTASDDWLEDDLESNTEVDPIESLRRRMEALGQNEGLERGIKSGEEKGFRAGFVQESQRAFMLGRWLGAAKAVLHSNPKAVYLNTLIHEAEASAAQDWVTNPKQVDDKLLAIQTEIARLGIHLDEWPNLTKGN